MFWSTTATLQTFYGLPIRLGPLTHVVCIKINKDCMVHVDLHQGRIGETMRPCLHAMTQCMSKILGLASIKLNTMAIDHDPAVLVPECMSLMCIVVFLTQDAQK